jgi:hypothetical protein
MMVIKHAKLYDSGAYDSVSILLQDFSNKLYFDLEKQ